MIWNQIKKLISKSKTEPIIFDEESNIYELINEIESYDLFSNEKTIIVKNLWLLKKEDKKLSEILISSLENINSKYKIIFLLEEDKINNKNSLIHFLLNNSKVDNVKKYNPKELISVIEKIIVAKKGTISHEAIIEFILKVPNDLRIIIQEIDKLLLLTKDITKEIVISETSDYFESDAFSFINAINEFDFKKIYETLQEKIINYEEIGQLLGQLNSHLNLSFLIHTNFQLGKNLKKIEEQYNIHHFRLRKAFDFLKKIGYKNLVYLISKNAELDFAIKNGSIDEIIGIKNLILDLFKIDL
ncbi:DNA polymerase III subunit delta [[Mycoplasma] mobile]|uniref:DNA polymerase III subunit delta n=1 Tax=[Mycoplasma] mobile TaxID=2118 RepID=UPI00059C2E28|nr:hypothetical protein [[Mycoplasma] mobile]